MYRDPDLPCILWYYFLSELGDILFLPQVSIYPSVSLSIMKSCLLCNLTNTGQCAEQNHLYLLDTYF